MTGVPNPRGRPPSSSREEIEAQLALSEPAATLTAHLEAELGPLCDALQPWVETSCGPHAAAPA